MYWGHAGNIGIIGFLYSGQSKFLILNIRWGFVEDEIRKKNFLIIKTCQRKESGIGNKHNFFG
jgi:hypothetical protein